jgi:hypothetical protein
MPKEIKDLRMIFLMSESEQKELDDFRLSHGIGSRGAAIRMLIRRGIEAEGRARETEGLSIESRSD